MLIPTTSKLFDHGEDRPSFSEFQIFWSLVYVIAKFRVSHLFNFRLNSSDSVAAIGIGACLKQNSDREYGPVERHVYDDGPPSDLELLPGFVLSTEVDDGAAVAGSEEESEPSISPTGQKDSGKIVPTEERTTSRNDDPVSSPIEPPVVTSSIIMPTSAMASPVVGTPISTSTNSSTKYDWTK